MATDVQLTLGLNLTVGSVPVALAAIVETSADKSVYTFDGSVQDARISLGDFLAFVGEQFRVDVQLPPEMNLTAEIDYVAGQVIYTKPATGNAVSELGVAGKFTLNPDTKPVRLQFYADVVIESPAPATGNPYVVGAAVETELEFARLPLVGEIPGFKDLTLTNIGFSYTNADPAKNNGKPVQFDIPQVAKGSNPLYTGSNPEAKNASTYTITGTGPQRSFNLNAKGFALTAGLVNKATGETKNNFSLPMALPAATPPPAPGPASYAEGKTSPPASPVHWIDINKQFGPVDLKQIGLNYSKGEATFGLSAGFALGGFGMDLQGLTVTFPLPLPGQQAGHTVSFGLDGLALSIQRGSFAMTGAFLRVIDDGVTNYYGEIAVKVGNFGLKALGGYAPAQGSDPASVFLFASVSVPLGGPPFLFITGLAGGFGVNRALGLPKIDELGTYILMPGSPTVPQAQGTAADTIKTVLPQFKKYLSVKRGEYWVAAGITFTSFEMIQAKALVTVAFGVDFQVALLGSCAMSFPAQGAAVAYIEIDIIASFTPASGVLAIDGRLSPASFIYGGFIKVAGGFAFYTWFGATPARPDDHKGDFVVTVGGYHPAFTKPDHYPVVPRLSLTAGMGPLQIAGEAYFALTPAMMMAGIRMTATWALGPIKAWFSAGVDFLFAWAPFHYEGSAYVSIGCSVNLGLFTLTVHVGATLEVWGPEFGGSATVDLDVVSFTIAFGAPRKAPPPVDWTTFKASFLPADSKPAAKAGLRAGSDPPPLTVNIIKASVTRGYAGSYGDDNWLVDPDDFQIDTNSTIPANNGQWTLQDGVDALSNDVAEYQKPDAAGVYLALPPATFSGTQVWNPNIDIGPMNQGQVQSYHTVTLLHVDSGTYVTNVSVMPLLLDTNAALWTLAPAERTANETRLKPWSLTGFRLSPIPRFPGRVANVPLESLLFGGGFSTGFRYQAAAVNGAFTVQAVEDADTLTITISGAHTGQTVSQDKALGDALTSAWVTGERASLVAGLAEAFGTYGPEAVTVTEMAQKAMLDWPAVLLLGANQ